MAGLMTVEELRQALGKRTDGRYESAETLRYWIKSGRCPFADFVQRGERTIFMIFRSRFDKWDSGEDLSDYLKPRKYHNHSPAPTAGGHGISGQALRGGKEVT